MSGPAFQQSLQFAHRAGKRGQIADFFLANLGQRFASPWLHSQFGTAFRARASEINGDQASPISIFNDYFFDAEAGCEVSHYWAELRRPTHLDLG